MKKIIIALPGNELLANKIASLSKCEVGKVNIRSFPDGETYVKIDSDVSGKNVVLVCTLIDPNTKIIPLFFVAKTAKELGAKSISIISPYLAYMRQDKQFNPGEGITSKYFAAMLSSFTDFLVTIDPHLHRTKSLSEIFSIPTKVIHATDLISEWIKLNVSSPLLIGPDSESKQWVSDVAHRANAPYIILTKERLSDRDVKVSNPDLAKYINHTPVLVDDIISTGRTMIETINNLKAAKMKPAVCIGVHAIFAENAYAELQNTGAKIITCNTINHESNQIDVSDLLAACVKRLN